MTSTTIQHIDIDSEDFEDAPKALRDYAKKLKAANEQLTTERDDARGRLASNAVAGVLKDQGYKNPKRVEKDLLADGIDPLDQDAVSGWLAEFGDDYAKGEVTPSAPVQTEEAAAQQAAYQQLNAGGHLQADAGLDKWQAVQNEITGNETGAELLALYKKHGI